MKYQSLVSSTTPSDLQEWLGQELEDRGIDSVYARSILSLLQQDCVDIDPWECQHLGNRQLKYGGPENLYTTTKLKHQKWKTWSKQILITSNSCCKTVFSDWERIKKQAAVDCLRSASDYVNDIEELIEKVYIKLKNFKSHDDDKDAIHLRNVDDQKMIDSFFIPPSSPTDEIKKYFAAFPSLNKQFEKTDIITDIYQHDIIKNAWCGVCVMQKNPNSHISQQCCQPHIDYGSLEQIKNNKQNVENTILLGRNVKQKNSLIDLKIKECIIDKKINQEISYNKHIQLAKYIIKHKKGSWKAMASSIAKNIALPLQNLVFIKINVNFFTEISFLPEENNFPSKKLLHIETYMVSDLLQTLIQCGFLVSNFSPLSKLDKIQEASIKNLIIFQKTNTYNLYNCSKLPLNLPIYNKDQSNYLERNLNLKMFPGSIHEELNISCFEHSPNVFKSERSEYDRFNFTERSSVSDKKIFTLPVDFNKVDSISSDISGDYSKINEFGIVKEEYVKKLNPNIPFSESFETTSMCPLENLSDNSLKDNKRNEMLYYNNVKNISLPSTLTSWGSTMDYSTSNCLLEENNILQNGDELGLHFENFLEQQLYLNDYAISFKRNSGQKFLKKALFIDKSCLSESPLYKEFLSISLGNSPNLIPQNNPNISNFSKNSKENEIVESKMYTGQEKYDYFQYCKAAVQISARPQQRYNKNDAMWLLYWGDNHSFISHTWKKDNTNVENIQQFELLHESKVISALSKEIKDDGDELLRGLDSISGTIDETAMIIDDEMIISTKCDIHYDNMVSISEESNNFAYNEEDILLHHLPNSQDFSEKNDAQLCTTFNDNSFIRNDMKTNNPDMLQDCASINQQLCYNDLEASDLSAFPNAYDNVGSFESNYYEEDGGWSFVSDSFLDYSTFVNPYERSCSLDDLAIEDSESGLSEFFNQKRMRCTSETDDDVKQFLRKQNQTQFQKRLKQKITTRKRPCCFFLQGTCTRSDCKFSHDLSTTTCRFWKEGSCFKGTTCPFLHGYFKENDKEISKLDQLLQNEDLDNTYSLESEADFPSLSSTKTEPSKAKSSPIEIIKVTRKEKI